MKVRIGALISLYKEEWEIVRNYEQFVSSINDHAREITHISYDHDLADEHYTTEMYVNEEAYYEAIKGTEKTGLDCARYMKWFYDENKIAYPVMFVHSMNPVGMQAIINVFKNES
jgi:hypothetical protein